MHDLIIGCAAIAGGMAGLIAIRLEGRRHRRQARLIRMSTTELHAELTRCTGAIMACARRGDKRGMRYAHRAMKPVMKVLKKRRAVYAATQTARHEGDE